MADNWARNSPKRWVAYRCSPPFLRVYFFGSFTYRSLPSYPVLSFAYNDCGNIDQLIETQPHPPTMSKYKCKELIRSKVKQFPRNMGTFHFFFAFKELNEEIHVLNTRHYQEAFQESLQEHFCHIAPTLPKGFTLSNRMCELNKLLALWGNMAHQLEKIRFLINFKPNMVICTTHWSAGTTDLSWGAYLSLVGSFYDRGIFSDTASFAKVTELSLGLVPSEQK